MRRSRRDGNHAALSRAFELVGCTVVDTASTGIPGFPDLVVGCVGVTHLVELKNPATRYGRAGLSQAQSAFNSDWRGGPMVAVSSTDEVAAVVGNWRKESRAG